MGLAIRTRPAPQGTRGSRNEVDDRGAESETVAREGKVEVCSCCYYDDELSVVEGFRAALCNVRTWEGLQMC